MQRRGQWRSKIAQTLNEVPEVMCPRKVITRRDEYRLHSLLGCLLGVEADDGVRHVAIGS